MINKVVDNVTYYCPRPNYKLSPLDISLSQKGLSLASNVLLGHPPANVFADDDGCIWISDLPTADLLIRRIKEEPFWVASICRQRNESFTLIKENLQIVLQHLCNGTNIKKSIIETFKLLCDIQTTFLSYVYLPLVDEILVTKFADLVSKYLNKIQAQQYIFSLLQPPTYFHDIIESGIIINEAKVLNIPPTEELFFFYGNINLNFPPVDFDSIIVSHFPEQLFENSLEDALEYSILRSIVPIFFQIGQEDLFIGKSIIIALSHCVYQIANIFVKSGVLIDVKQILNFKQEEIIATAQKLEY